MNLLFFQNCVSPHQVPYIKEICNDDKVSNVYLVVPRINASERMTMGWDSNDMLANTNIILVLNPSDDRVHLLFNLEDVYAFFTGIRADDYVFHWLKISLHYKITRGIITESPYIFRKPLCLHKIRFLLQDYKYIKSINYVFAIGQLAVDYYRFWSKRWKVFPFQYCTESYKRVKPIPNVHELQLLYVGSLSTRKNVKFVLKSMGMINNKKIHFTLIGDGKQRKILEDYVIANNLNVSFLGTVPMKNISLLMQDYDVLILPSLHDGWGAVVNEALTVGLYVLCSNQCGAKQLIDDVIKGDIFDVKRSKQLGSLLLELSNKITWIRETVDERIVLSKNIQGKSVAKYFIEQICE